MTTDSLIRALVSQTTILVARLATTQGGRASLARIPDQVFLGLVRELERQGVGRKVSADMFGVGLRTHRRQIHRVMERTGAGGRSLWEAILESLAQSEKPLSRDEVLQRFARDDELQVRAILRDLCASGLVEKRGRTRHASYEASPRGREAALLLRGDLDAEDDALEENTARPEGDNEVDAALECLRGTLGALRRRCAQLSAAPSGE